MKKIISKLLLTLPSVAFFAGLAFICYFGSFWRLIRLDHLILANLVIAALGSACFASLFCQSYLAILAAGALYGFNPLTITISHLNPLAGAIAAIIPWLFFIAAALPAKIAHFRWFFPFLAILALFYLLSLRIIGPYFPIPAEKIHYSTLHWPIISPFLADTRIFISFYHVALLALLPAIWNCIYTPKLIPLLVGLIISLAAALTGIYLFVPASIWLLTAASLAIILICNNLEAYRTNGQYIIVALLLDVAISARFFVSALF